MLGMCSVIPCLFRTFFDIVVHIPIQTCFFVLLLVVLVKLFPFLQILLASSMAPYYPILAILATANFCRSKSTILCTFRCFFCSFHHLKPLFFQHTSFSTESEHCNCSTVCSIVVVLVLYSTFGKASNLFLF